MTKNRVEAFSDGVFAILITIMVLELKAPKTGDVGELLRLVPTFLSYALSFVYLGIYWNNHHHLFHVAQHVKGLTLWANLHLLFWLSLIPFVSAWIGETEAAPWATCGYGVVLLLCAVAYRMLVVVLVNDHDSTSSIHKALRHDRKGVLSMALYFVGILISPWAPLIGCLAYVGVAAMWLIPDRRIEVRI